MLRHLTQIVRLPVLLGLVGAVAFTASTHPAIHQRLRRDGQPAPSGYGPVCLLRAAPSDEAPDLWQLEHPRMVMPFQLVVAGYPEEAQGSHDVVARVTCTAYTSRPCETDATPFITASNKQTRMGYIALSRDLLSNYTAGAPFRFGDRIELIGVGTFQVEDTMNARWNRRADIWMPSLETAWAWGRRTVLIAKLDEKQDDIALLASPEIGREGT